jgi:hypothetical protein
MQAYTERLAGGLTLVRTLAAAIRGAAKAYWTWITSHLDPIGAAYGTCMAIACVLFFLYSALV